MIARPTPEQVMLLAPDRSAAAAATAAADPGAWSAAGFDEHAVWGRYVAGSAEPYEVAVALAAPHYRCTCPSRKVPCKHGLGLLLMYAGGRVAPARRLPFVDEWLQRVTALRPPDRPGRPGEGTDRAGDEVAEIDAACCDTGPLPAGAPAGGVPAGGSGDAARERRRNERAERMRAGLVELDRWLADRVRHGLAAAELADPGTWERLAARLVDAQCASLANRITRIATRVGSHSRWHDDVLEEFALVHALVRGAVRTWALPDDLCDGVHAATGLTVAKADVLAGVPTTATWCVLGESRVREDRITVQRTWLCHQSTDTAGAPRTTWALELAFGAIGAELDPGHRVGTAMVADVHWYPGAVPLRALVGRVHRGAEPMAGSPRGLAVADGLAEVGRTIAAEPWIERVPLIVDATPVPVGNGRWVLADHTGALPIVPGFRRLAELVALGGGRALTVMGEYTSEGVLPLTVVGEQQAVAL